MGIGSSVVQNHCLGCDFQVCTMLHRRETSTFVLSTSTQAEKKTSLRGVATKNSGHQSFFQELLFFENLAQQKWVQAAPSPKIIAQDAIFKSIRCFTAKKHHRLCFRPRPRPKKNFTQGVDRLINNSLSIRSDLQGHLTFERKGKGANRIPYVRSHFCIGKRSKAFQ